MEGDRSLLLCLLNKQKVKLHVCSPVCFFPLKPLVLGSRSMDTAEKSTLFLKEVAYAVTQALFSLNS